MSSLAPEIIDSACLDFLQGQSIRHLSKRFQIPRSTLHYHLVKRLGKNCRRANQGLLAVLQEYLQSRNLSERDKVQLRRWLSRNAGQVIACDRASNTRLLTLRKEQALTRQECGFRSDFRGTIEAVWSGLRR